MSSMPTNRPITHKPETGHLPPSIVNVCEQSLRAREAEAMCDHVWIAEPSRSCDDCGVCGVYRMEPRCREPGIQTHGGPDQEKPSGLAPRAALGIALVLAGDQAL